MELLIAFSSDFHFQYHIDAIAV